MTHEKELQRCCVSPLPNWMHVGIRVVKLLLIVIVIVIVMKRLWRESNSNSNRLLKIPE